MMGKSIGLTNRLNRSVIAVAKGSSASGAGNNHHMRIFCFVASNQQYVLKAASTGRHRRFALCGGLGQGVGELHHTVALMMPFKLGGRSLAASSSSPPLLSRSLSPCLSVCGEAAVHLRARPGATAVARSSRGPKHYQQSVSQ